MKPIAIYFLLYCITAVIIPSNCLSKTIEYNLVIEEKPVTIHGKTSQGMTINGSIPGPVLRFTEGDSARITVHNKMAVDTSIHWHGLLVPPRMDGVPYISFPPIKPGRTFVYEFLIRQSGTYWYHSHTHLQEQKGLYGGIIIAPKGMMKQAVSDTVILLSDWTTENPDAVLKTLKSGSEWYSLQKGSSQSIIGAVMQNELGSYFKRELQRMPPMDIADVAYDFFLANGSPQSVIHAEPQEKIRLRIINGSATTYFYVEFSGGQMQIVSADGQDVHPVSKNRFLIGVAETYDVIISIPGSGAFEFRATAHDGSGHSSVWIGSGKRVTAPDIPKPNLYYSMDHGGMNNVFALTPQGTMGMPDNMIEKGYFDSPGMTGMDHSPGADHKGHLKQDRFMTHKSSSGRRMKKNDPMPMNRPDEKTDHVHTPQHGHHPMDMDKKMSSAENKNLVKGGKQFSTDFRFLASDVSSSSRLANDGMSPERPWPPYKLLRSKKKTSLSKEAPIKEFRLTLDGDMERYVWLLNKKPLSESDSILIQEGQVVRFIMINRTMMHHPMHLHGHFFRVLNGQGDYSPLKHTVDVAPMSTTVIEFDANEAGDWFFHCHLLYHMKSGMARKLHYVNYQPPDNVKAVSAILFKDPWYLWGEADVLSNMTEGSVKLADTRNTVELFWEAGWHGVDETHWEGALLLDRYVNRFFSAFAGGFMEGENSEEKETKGIFGIQYLLPLNIASRSWIDTEGDARFNFEKEFELTPRLALEAEMQYDTKEDWETSVGLAYLLHKNISLKIRWHSEYELGAGVTIRF